MRLRIYREKFKMNKKNVIVCPFCKASLKRKTYKLQCSVCAKEFTYFDSIYDFLCEDSYYWGEISDKEMNEVLGVTKKEGWRNAAVRLSLRYPSLGRYILSSSRTDWIFHCLDRSNTSACLDIGSGWGGNSFALSKFYKEVWSLEAVKQRIEFQKIRSMQDGVKNIKFLRSDWMRLPFPDQSFDLVVANGVLEWVGLSDYSKHPRVLQLDFLKEVKRVLKPNGCLYIGIENRYGLQFFLGGRDHSGMPFTSLLPRKIADLVVRKFRKTDDKYINDKRIKEEWKDYRTYTYSIQGYKKILSDAGYNAVNIYWTNSYNFPRIAGRFDHESFSYFVNWLKGYIPSKYKVLHKRVLNIFIYIVPDILKEYLALFFCPNFLVFAYKKNIPKSIETDIFMLINKFTSFIRISGSHSPQAKITYFLLKNKRPYQIIKFPRFKEYVDDIKKEEKMISRFNNVKIKKMKINSMTMYIEPSFQGVPCQPYNPYHNLLAVKWLFEFQKKTEKGICDYNYFRETIKENSKLFQFVKFNHEIQKYIQEQLDLFLKMLQKVKVMACAEHGDFCTNNIIIGKDKKLFVIDWEHYRDNGDSLFDFVFFILCNIIKDRSLKALKNNIKGKGKYSPILKMLLLEYSRSKNLPVELILLSVPYVLLRCLYRSSMSEENRQINIAHFVNLFELWYEFCSKNSVNFAEKL